MVKLPKPPPELIDLPDEPLQIIADNLGLFGVINLQKVCQRFRNLLENHSPSVNLGQVTILVFPDVLMALHALAEERFNIIYKKTSNGCTVTSNKPNKNGQTVTLEIPNGDYKNIFFDDLEKNLRLQKTLLWRFRIIEQSEDTSFLEKLSSILRARKLQLEVTLLHKSVAKLGDAQFILPHLDSKSLEGIGLERRTPSSQRVTKTEMEQISNLEQWKRAKQIGIRATFVVDDLYRYVSHAEYVLFHNQIEDFRFEDLLACREKIISCDFKEIVFRYQNSKDEQQVLQMLGLHFYLDQDKKQWIFNAPNRKVLIVQLKQGELVIHCTDYDDTFADQVQPMFEFPEINVAQIE